jgi:hypothetical protein
LKYDPKNVTGKSLEKTHKTFFENYSSNLKKTSNSAFLVTRIESFTVEKKFWSYYNTFYKFLMHTQEKETISAFLPKGKTNFFADIYQSPFDSHQVLNIEGSYCSAFISTVTIVLNKFGR